MKRELSQKPNLCLCGPSWEIFLKKSSHRGNAQTIYLYINKSLQKICCSLFKALSIMNVFSLYSRFNSIQLKTIITTKVYFSCRKMAWIRRSRINRNGIQIRNKTRSVVINMAIKRMLGNKFIYLTFSYVLACIFNSDCQEQN